MTSLQLRVFLFADVVNSSRLWSESPDRMHQDCAEHREILRSAVEANDGELFFAGGETVGAAFDSATAAAEAAVAAHQARSVHQWQVPNGISVRTGIHIGEAERRAGRYFGPALGETARMMAVAHPGQVLMSARVAELVPGRPVRDLGEHVLRDVEGRWHLYQLVLPGTHEEHPPLDTDRAGHRSLPVQRTSLVGRERAVEELRELVMQRQLATVTGPAGAGKTRVAIEAAGRCGRSFERLHFVDLTTVARGDDVVPVLLDGLGLAVPSDADPLEEILTELESTRTLVVFDNCEHVIESARRVVDRLTSTRPDVHILATSRVALDLDGEQVVAVAPLDASGVDSPAASLFIERALAVDPTQRFGDRALSVVVSIVQQLDGMPLAIELAAARTRSLGVDQIREHLADRFRLLVGAPSADPRQRSLEAALSWSVDLLSTEERGLLLQLSTCAGSFTLPLVARLLGNNELEALELLDRLVAQNLIRSSRVSRQAAYDMLESIRDFGRRELRRSGSDDDATARLERALLPTPEDDMFVFINDYLEWSARTTVEAETRRAATAGALAAGRTDVAARLLITAVSPTHPGAFEPLLAIMAQLRDELADPTFEARVALDAADLQLQAFTFRLVESLETVERAVASTDGVAGLFFQAWRLLIMTAVDPDVVVAETEALLPVAMADATHDYDYSVSMMATARAIALLAAERTEEAHETAQLAVRWTRRGTGIEGIALPTLLWMEYTEGLPRGPELAAAVDEEDFVVWESRTRIAAAIAAEAPLEDRARKLVDLARAGPLGLTLYEECTFLVPFAWLAIEEQDFDRAKFLLQAFASADPGTGTAGVRALDRIQRHETGEPVSREAVLGQFLAPNLHEKLSTAAPRALAEELDRWERRLSGGRTSTEPSTVMDGERSVVAESTSNGMSAASTCNVLGPMDITVRGDPVELSHTHRAIVSALALSAPRSLGGPILADAVWGEDPPRSAHRSLQSHISRLRLLLGSTIVEGNSSNGYRLRIDPDEIDVHRFRSLVARASREAPAVAAETLSSACELWRGEPAPDVADTSALRAELAALEQEHLAAEEALCQALLAAGDPDAAVVLGERLVAASPLRECRWISLIDSHIAADRRADALQAYRRARQVLVEDLGLDPGDALQAAEARALGLKG